MDVRPFPIGNSTIVSTFHFVLRFGATVRDEGLFSPCNGSRRSVCRDGSSVSEFMEVVDGAPITPECRVPYDSNFVAEHVQADDQHVAERGVPYSVGLTARNRASGRVGGGKCRHEIRCRPSCALRRRARRPYEILCTSEQTRQRCGAGGESVQPPGSMPA